MNIKCMLMVDLLEMWTTVLLIRITARQYGVNYTDKEVSDNENDVLPLSNAFSEIILTGGFGKMNRHKREAIIRFRHYNKDAEPSNWYRAKLMLYYSWYNEVQDLLRSYLTYEQHYQRVHSIVLNNESKYSQADV